MTTEQLLTLKLDIINLPLRQFAKKYRNVIIEDGKVVYAELT